MSSIKSYLPVSSRSAHAMHEDILALREDIDALRRDIASFDSRAMTLLWENYRREGETLPAAKERFFRELEPATGAMRVYQLALAQLLFEFDRFCAEHGIRYWAASGTLLGAVRHQGFIPWDDDLDVGMTRQDIARAVEFAAADGRYAITTRFDYHFRCRQVHFRYADSSIPCFIDLFIHDPIKVDPLAALERHVAEREALREDVLMDEMLTSFEGDSLVFDEGTELGERLRAHFDEHLAALYGKDGICTDDLDAATGVIWALDNIDGIEPDHSWYPIPAARLLPFSRSPFEGFDINVPADARAVAEAHYGDIYELPAFAGFYFDHLDHAGILSEETQEALSALIEQGGRAHA